MDNYIGIEILPIKEEYMEKAIEFDNKNKKEIEEIKNIFLENLNEYEKNRFLDIINENEMCNIAQNNEVQIIEKYNEIDTIKEYITISMINSINNKNYNLYDIILFIPTNSDIIKTKINEYIYKNNKELIKNIIYGSLDLYKFVSNIDEEM